MGVVAELRDRWRHRDDPLQCRQVVELVTEYLEGSMSEGGRERFERHLRTCGPCVRYLDQVRHTIDVLGHVHPEDPSGKTRAALIDAFREFQRD